MGFLKDAFNFEVSHTGDLWNGIKKDPKRLVLGVDPFSTTVWNKVLGRNDDPLVNQFGGPLPKNYENAEAKGIDTGPARTLHGVAQTVAGAYATGGAASGLGEAGGAVGGNTGAAMGSAIGQAGVKAGMAASSPFTQTATPTYAPVDFGTNTNSSLRDALVKRNSANSDSTKPNVLNKLIAQMLMKKQ